MSPTRRTILRSAAIVSAVSLAGCTGVLGESDAAATFDGWLYEPGTVGDADHYLAVRYQPATIAERANSFDADVYDVLQAFGSDARETVGVAFGETTEQLVYGQNAVIAGEFDPEDVASRISADEFVAEGEYSGFETYVGVDEDVAVGIGSDVLVVTYSTGIFGMADDAEVILQSTIDVHGDDRRSYRDASGAFDALLDAVDESALQSVRTHDETDATDADAGEFAGEVARGIDSQLVEDGIETTFALVFTDEAAVDETALQRWVDENRTDGTFEDFSSVDVSADGRVGLVTGVEPTSQYDFYVESA